jgi:NAD(P)-dependent dehydrogenase (short-subunit alcohol dehydrogenase family)
VDQLTGAVAVVTGAASGIGLAVAERMARAGASVVMTDIDGDALADAAVTVGTSGSDVDTAVLDVRDADAVEHVAARCVERHGGLHIAVNNAGIVNGGPARELSLDDWHRVIDIDLWGVIHGVRAFVPRILATGGQGHVVNVASMAAVQAIAGIAPYTVAKHGVLGLSDVLRADLENIGADVGVSVVMPGRIRTGMNPIGTVEPETVADNVVDAILRGRRYVFTDDHSTRGVQARLEAIIAARDDVLG